MAKIAPVTSLQERPVFFSAGAETLFGILTIPETKTREIGVVLLPGGRIPSTGRNRMFVRLCRELGGLGYHALRFEYRGAGESTGSFEKVTLDKPFTSDLLGAVEYLRSSGLRKLILVGTCFGARTALSSAPEIAGLEGVVLASVPTRAVESGQRNVGIFTRNFNNWELLKRGLRPRMARQILRHRSRRLYVDFARFKFRAFCDRMLRRETWQKAYKVSANFLHPFSLLAERGVRVLFVYGEDDDLYREFQIARSGVLGPALVAHPDVEVATLAGDVHSFSSLAVQDAMIRLICDRLPQWTDSIPTEDTSWTST